MSHWRARSSLWKRSNRPWPQGTTDRVRRLHNPETLNPAVLPRLIMTFSFITIIKMRREPNHITTRYRVCVCVCSMTNWKARSNAPVPCVWINCMNKRGHWCATCCHCGSTSDHDNQLNDDELWEYSLLVWCSYEAITRIDWFSLLLFCKIVKPAQISIRSLFSFLRGPSGFS